MKNLLIVGALTLSSISTANAFSFVDAVKIIESHDAVKVMTNKARKLNEDAEERGSWGDPMFKVAAKNFPKDSLEDDKTPMTGIEFGISQKIALTTKYGNMEDALKSMGESKHLDAKDKKRELIKSLWMVVSKMRRLGEEITIFEENLEWVNKILTVSKRRYRNGKISQQALLDIQIRKSEIEAGLSNKEFNLKESQENLSYILGTEGTLNFASIPWRVAESKSSIKLDIKELSLQSKLKAKRYLLTAKKQAFIPDVKVALGYTKRSNIDGNGDFVSAAITFPLPFSGSKYAAHSGAVFDKMAAEKSLRNYQKRKSSEERRFTHSVAKIKRELKILNSKTIIFAENSRKVTSKSYAIGRSTYIELLQSELKLQSLLLKRSNLNEKLVKQQILKKFLIGEKLYE